VLSVLGVNGHDGGGIDFGIDGQYRIAVRDLDLSSAMYAPQLAARRNYFCERRDNAEGYLPVKFRF
jgi:hypothetical protein